MLWHLASEEKETLEISFGLSSHLLKGFRYKAFSASPLGSGFVGCFSNG
jgi:hypothetical protein